MKRVVLSIIIVLSCLLTIAQMPDSFVYQAIVLNESGGALAVQPVSYRFSIIQGTLQGPVVYSEKHSVTTDKSGLVTLAIGDGKEKTSDFGAIKWSEDDFFLKTEIDISGGVSYIDKGTTQILSVPYASPSEASKKSPLIVIEDELFISRKYVGKFVEYRQTGPKTNNGQNLIWIKTSMEKTFGKISAYGKKCEFSEGDNLYIKRTFYNPGEVSGIWVYRIENDSSTYYRVTDFQHDSKVLVETWFE